jgi:glucose-1-phosphate thymidylyltransferase
MTHSDVIGLLPCGGHATRIAPLPCSKELFPVGLRRMPDGSLRSKVVSQYLLEKMHRAGVRTAFLILRRGKWDIPEYYGDGTNIGMHLGYLMMHRPYGPAYTLDQAYPFIAGRRVALGFPDILCGPGDAFTKMLDRLSATRSEVVLSLYRAHDPPVSDMIATDRTGRVLDLLIKPAETTLQLGWIFAVWTPVFTEFLHHYLTEPRTAAERPGSGLPNELSVGHVLQAAIRAGLRTDSVLFDRHDYLDIGTPEALRLTVGGSRCDELDIDTGIHHVSRVHAAAGTPAHQ